MGGCLFREKEQTLINESTLIQYTGDLQYEELNDVQEIMNFKNIEILQITQIKQQIIVLKKYTEKQINFKIIEIVGNTNMMYLEIHKQLQQSQNYFIGSITIQDKCYLIVRVVYGLAAQVSVQEIQTIEDDLHNVIRKRWEEKYLCVGTIYIEDMLILVFRQIFLKMKCPIVQQYNTHSNDTICLIQYGGQIYELKKQI